MKAKFGTSEIFEGLVVINFTALIALLILMFHTFNTVWLVLFIILIIPFAILIKLQSGVISANKNKLVIYHRLFNRRVFISTVYMRDIKSAECTVKTAGDRFGRVSFHLHFTVTKKNGRKLIFSKSIDCPKEFNAKKLEELVDGQPLQKLCDFINEQIQTRV